MAADEYQTLEGIETIESLVIVPIGSSMKDFDDMGLKIGKRMLNGKTVKYIFQAEVHTWGSFLFVDSISLKLDDHIFNFKDDTPGRHVLQNGDYFLEVLAFEIPPEMLEEIKRAKTFSVELYKRVAALNQEEIGENHLNHWSFWRWRKPESQQARFRVKPGMTKLSGWKTR